MDQSNRTGLTDPDRKLNHTALVVDTDAAGGSTRSFGKGMIIYKSTWTIVQWGRKINKGALGEGNKNLESRMSAWELLGPLLVVCTAPDKVKNKQVVVMVDNEGSV